MGSTEPSFRSAWTKLALGQVKLLGSEQRGRVYDALGDLRSVVRGAGLLEFLDAEVHVGVADRLYDALGADGARALWCRVMVGAFDRGLLRPLVAGSVRLYGASPDSILRMTPQAYKLAGRHIGSVEVDRSILGQISLAFSDMPPVLTKSLGLLECYRANCDAAIEYLRLTGDVAIPSIDSAAGTLELSVTWSGVGAARPSLIDIVIGE